MKKNHTPSNEARQAAIAALKVALVALEAADGCVEPERTRHPQGQLNGAAKLTDAEAALIYTSTEPAAVLARRYGINIGHIYGIRCGRKWSCLTAGLEKGDVSRNRHTKGSHR